MSLGVLLLLSAACAGAEGSTPASAPPAAKRKIVFIPGPPSHGYGGHAHQGGCSLLAKILSENVPGMQTVLCKDGWPKDPSVLDGANAIVVSCDGGRIIIDHLAEIDALMNKGVGLACLHYTVDVPKGKVGQKMLDWIGGYYEQHWSVNPTWTAEFKTFPNHPITRGLKPFRINDEWYYHMRFREDANGLTPILSAVPPDSTRKGPDGSHSGNPTVRSRLGMAEHVAWAYQRPNGGRGFGFTGMHTHWNWAQDGFRTTVLNAVVWIAGGEVPAGGVPSKTPTLEELESHLGVPRHANWKPDATRKMIEAMNQPADK
jgi:hypothetical protein